MTRTAYVTGSNGFLGLNLCAELAHQGWRVLALHRAKSDIAYLSQLAVERLEGDINDPPSLARTLPRQVDAVFHVAGSTNLWSKLNAGQDRIDIEGTRNMVGAALAAGAKVRKGIARGLQAVIVNPAGIIGPYDTGGYARLFRMVHSGALPGVPPVSLFTGKQPNLTREAAAMATRTLFCDCSKAVRELGFERIALKKMVGDCYRWMKAEGRLGPP